MNRNELPVNWLRSKHVKRMLGGISDSTLQTLRVNGTIPAYRLGSIWYYKEDEIRQILEVNKLKIWSKDE
jgi:hypothetical protein